MNKFTSIGKKIREARKNLGMTQLELGRLTGYTESSVSHIEKGEVDLPISKVKSLAVALRVPVDYLIGDFLEENDQPEPGKVFETLPKEQRDAIMREIERKIIMEGVKIWPAQNGTEKDGDSESQRTV